MAIRERDPSLGPPAARIGLGALHTLPPTLKPVEAFDLLGVGRTSGYELIRKGELPVLRLGGKLLVPTAHLLRLVGLDWDQGLASGTGEAANEGDA